MPCVSCPRARVAFDVPVKINDHFNTWRMAPCSSTQWHESGVLSLMLPERSCVNLVKNMLASLSCYALILSGPSETNERTRPSNYATMN